MGTGRKGRPDRPVFFISSRQDGYSGEQGETVPTTWDGRKNEQDGSCRFSPDTPPPDMINGANDRRYGTIRKAEREDAIPIRHGGTRDGTEREYRDADRIVPPELPA